MASSSTSSGDGLLFSRIAEALPAGFQNRPARKACLAVAAGAGVNRTVRGTRAPLEGADRPMSFVAWTALCAAVTVVLGIAALLAVERTLQRKIDRRDQSRENSPQNNRTV